MMRVGLFRPVHAKTLQSQQRRMLLTTRKLLQSKMLDLENDLRGTLKNFGFKVGRIGAVGLETRVRARGSAPPRRVDRGSRLQNKMPAAVAASWGSEQLIR